MATEKKRINITADADVESSLAKAAKRDRVPIATKAAELLRIGLDLEEDMALATIADQRSHSKVKFIPHNLAWK